MVPIAPKKAIDRNEKNSSEIALDLVIGFVPELDNRENWTVKISTNVIAIIPYTPIMKFL